MTEASPEVALNPDNRNAAPPLDFLLITSRIDFDKTCRRFLTDSARAGLNVEIIYIEDLVGTSTGDKLEQLLQLNAQWQSGGKITGSTIKVALLHGGTVVPPADPGIDQFRRNYVPAVETTSSQACSDPSAGNAPVHVMTAAADTLTFPTELFDIALRTAVAGTAQDPAGFLETIIYGSCESALFREAARKTGGSYVFGIGKKSGYLVDFEAGLFEIVNESGHRKRQGSAPLSARDCWTLIRNISGEHVSFVGNDTLEINKVLQASHSEPLFTSSAKSITAQAIRILFAKIKHGSADSVRQVIEKWGAEILSADHSAVMTRLSLWAEAIASPRDAEQKVKLLMTQLRGFILDEAVVLNCLKGFVGNKWRSTLADLFAQLAAHSPPPLALENFVYWLKANPDTQRELEKLCRSSGPLSDALGLYLLKATEEDAKNFPHRLFVIPPFLENLATRMQKKMHVLPQQ